MAVNCKLEVGEKLKDKIATGDTSVDVIQKISEEVTEIIRDAQARGADVPKEVNTYLKEVKAKQQIAAYQRALTEVKNNKAFDYIHHEQFGPEKSHEGLMSILAPMHKKKYVGIGDVSSTARAVSSQGASILVQRLHSVDGAMNAAKKGSFEEEIHAVANGLLKKEDASPIVQGIVDAFQELNDYSFHLKRDAGMPLAYRKNRLVKMAHPSDSLKKMGFDEWRKIVVEDSKLDYEAMGIKSDELDDFLQKFYEKKTDVGQAIEYGKDKSWDASRGFVFKGNGSYTYRKAVVGDKTTLQSLIDELRSDSAAVAAARILGPNYTSSFDKLLKQVSKDLRNNLTPDQARTKLNELKDTWKLLMNKDPMKVGESLMAKFGDKARKLTNMAMLSTSVLSTAADIPLGAGVVSSLTGRNLLGETGHMMKGLAQNVPRSKRMQYAKDMMIFTEDYLSQMTFDRFGPGSGGIFNNFDKIHHLWMTATGLPDQSLAARTAVAKRISTILAEDSDIAFKDLYGGMKEGLQKFGIDEAKWDIIRNSNKSDFGDGTLGLTAEEIGRIPDSAFEGMDARGIRGKKQELQANLQGFLTYYAERGSPMQDVALSRVTQLADPNTIRGQGVLFASQFKSFTLSIYNTMQVIHGTGSTGKFGNVGLVSGTAALATIAGYAVDTAQDFVKGRDFKDPTEYKTWMSAAIRGGVGGIYADFILADRGRGYREFTSDVMGPVLGGPVSDIARLVSSAVNGDFSALGKGSLDAVERYLPTLPIVAPILNYHLFTGVHGVLNMPRSEARKRYWDRN